MYICLASLIFCSIFKNKKKVQSLEVLHLRAAHGVNGTLTFCAKTSGESFGFQVTWNDLTQQKLISSAPRYTVNEDPLKSGTTVLFQLYFIDITDQFTQTR